MTPAEKLKTIADHYLEDTGFLASREEGAKIRFTSLSGIQDIIQRFVQGSINIKTFRDELDTHLRKPEHNAWGTKGNWMMTLNQLAANHDSVAETKLRQMLDGLNAHNVAERFVDFAAFLAEEKQRIRVQSNKLAAPGKSPYFLTLFADWLDPQGEVIVIWPSLREGVAVLHNNAALPPTFPLKIAGDDVRITTAEDYRTLQQVRDWIGTTEPRLAQHTEWWYEQAMAWVRDHKYDIPAWLESDETTEIAPINSIPDEPLASVPPHRLQEQIAKLRRELLIPTAVIERIYIALVLGQHVILSGPPGTGKTELAKLLPRLLWMGEEQGPIAETPYSTTGLPYQMVPTTRTAYAVQLVTATDEWTPRHVIGGIVPVTQAGTVRYTVAYGCLAQTIFDNWDFAQEFPASWSRDQRKLVNVTQEDGVQQSYRGCWLVIDEFNRAPIDLALGEAMTALGGGATALHIPTDSGNSTQLPIPHDFRIIGTLNTFDRHFLNEMSEALKRRFAFIEVLPPARLEREAEQAMVLHQVLTQLARVQPESSISVSDTEQHWPGLVRITHGNEWVLEWEQETAARRCFAEGWRLFEVIRLYRQFGTAQAITWATTCLGAGLLKQLDWQNEQGWRACLDIAFADTLADQLQILFPDEIEVLLAYLQTSDAPAFAQEYNRILANLLNPNRRKVHMLALQSVTDADGNPFLTAEQAQTISEDEQAEVPQDVLTPLFHADQPRANLPQLTERLQRFLFERTI